MMSVSLKVSPVSFSKSLAGTKTRGAQKPAFGRRPLRVSSLSVGDRMPYVDVAYMDDEGNKCSINIGEACAGKKVVMFAVPGAFTPTCSLKHLPGFINNADAFKAQGVDMIACVSVNDVYVMDVWKKAVGAGDKVMMLADGGAVLTRALGVDMDKTNKGLGVRSRRYSMLLENGEVKLLNLEDGGGFNISSAEDMLAAMGGRAPAQAPLESFFSSGSSAAPPAPPAIDLGSVQPFWGSTSSSAASPDPVQVSDVGNVQPFWGSNDSSTTPAPPPVSAPVWESSPPSPSTSTFELGDVKPFF